MNIMFEKNIINRSSKPNQTDLFCSILILKNTKNQTKPNRWRYLWFGRFTHQKTIQTEPITPLATPFYLTQSVSSNAKEINLWRYFSIF